MSDYSVSFGNETFWQEAYAAFPGFWNVYPRLVEAVNSVAVRGYPSVGQREKVIINLGIYAGTSLSEIATLVGNGYGQGALKITRSMLEISINAEFLRLFPEHVDDYLDWACISQYRQLSYIRANASDLLTKSAIEPDEIDSEYQRVKGRFEIVNASGKTRLRPGWCTMDLPARATKTNFQDAYSMYYPVGNDLLHGTISGMSMHSDASSESSRIKTEPSLKHCRLALVGAHTCAIRMIETISKTMSVESTPSMDVLHRDYADAWPSGAEEDHAAGI